MINSVWLLPWHAAPLVIFLMIIAGGFYARGVTLVPQKAWQVVCFWVGLLSLYAAWQTRFDYYAAHEFFLGCIQQGTLQHFSPFLLVLAQPGTCLKAGLPNKIKVCLSHLKSFPFFSAPYAAAIIFNATMLFWLIPKIHFAAMLDWRLSYIMNWSMVLSGLWFWTIALKSGKKPATGARIIMLLAVVPLQIVIGAILTFAPHNLYTVYVICGRAFGSITPLQDQQIGGVIIWLHGAMMSIIGVLLIFYRETKNPQF